jgi:hypothetical protein
LYVQVRKLQQTVDVRKVASALLLLPEDLRFPEEEVICKSDFFRTRAKSYADLIESFSVYKWCLRLVRAKVRAEIECNTGPKSRTIILMEPLTRSDCLETEYASCEYELSMNDIGSLVEKNIRYFREHLEGVNRYLYVHSDMVSFLTEVIQIFVKSFDEPVCMENRGKWVDALMAERAAVSVLDLERAGVSCEGYSGIVPRRYCNETLPRVQRLI